MIEYISKTGFEPRSHMNRFHEFVKESLSFAGATQTQLYEKVRRLKEKFEKNVRGENPEVYAKPMREKGFYGSVGGWSFDEKAVIIVKDGLELISESKKVEFEGKWEQLRVDEIEHYLTKLDLIREQMMLVIETMKSYDGMLPDYTFNHHKTPSFLAPASFAHESNPAFSNNAQFHAPKCDINGFHEFVKESLSFAGATQTQLYEKVRRLREKYEKNAKGKNPEAFAKPMTEKYLSCPKRYRRIMMVAVKIVKDGLELISESKKVDLEGKWEQLRVDEVEHYLTKLDLIREQMILVIEMIKSYDGMLPDYTFKHHKTPSLLAPASFAHKLNPASSNNAQFHPPKSDINGFHEFVKESLSFAGATQTRLYEKVRRLREKYEKNARGENPEVFAMPHEGKVFVLSKKIWENIDGCNGMGNKSVWKRS
ncbi:hypothetical protein Vadar_027067 [Vaccinium darrowii]|uniref:Uncharacterized protein n=1 Tax=Vaccinium darrowii TaxID=229202 RepID=A0ACB7Y1W2_9ERIC|nr:hypothetical protein Vadar_027067 [Vaccinium darrowii]